MRHLWYLLLVGVFLVGSLVMGCGGDGDAEPSPAPAEAEEAVDGEAEAVEEPGEEELVEEVESSGDPEYLAEGWVDFAAFYSKVQSATWDLGGEATVQYDYEGTDTLDGMDVEKVSVHAAHPGEEDEFSMVLWVGEDGEVVQGQSNGETLEDMELGFAMMMFPPLLPFYGEAEFAENLTQALAGQDVSDWENWEVLSRDSSRENVGGKRINVYTVEIDHPAWGDGPHTFSFGDFGAFKMLLSFESLDHSFYTEALSLR